VMIPEGYGTGVVYGQRPLTSDSQLTFSRASTATRVNASGLIETVASNVPRLDYLGSSCPRLLLEPQRTNLYNYSEQLNQWTATNATVTANYAVSPDGYTNADRVQFSAGGLLYVSGTGSAGENTLSVYAKATNGTSAKFRFFGNGNTIYSSDQTATGEWQRFTFTYTYSAATAGLARPTTSVDDVIFWGFQHEIGAYATSYIPTTAAAVTRLADECSKTGIASLIGQTEGTLFCDIQWTVKPEAGSPIVGLLSTNSASNLNDCIVLGIERQSGGLNRFYSFVQVAGSITAALIGSSLTTGRYKAAFAYKANDFVLYVNGVQIATDTSGAVPTNSQVIVGGRFVGDSFQVSDPISQTLVFKTRLSNEQLQTLTSL
jgi:hypothetical protein